ncbi:granzyme H-like [Triplophysa dalaica]|uniref:granzyme H-like n=1 Tax=Triplophysa dalaica TaxID=1582913 RepID=UPI0024DFAA91|nr:granzyme H-like [Triplophysa dalaica]
MIFTLLLLGALLPHVTFTAYVNVGIVNGTEAKPHSRPYMVSVQRNKQHICGGFLVSEQFVMTAAHCFENGQSLTVVVGAQDLKHSSDHIAVKFYHIHPGYDSENLQNDIMLLQFNRTTKKTNSVKPISLPNKKRDIKAKSKCSVAGWGRQTTNGSLTNRLMEVDVTVIDSKSCQKYWGKTSRMVCAIGHGGFCQGDSGGPLVCKDTAVGIVSFNEKNNCNKPTRPNVYTKISKFLPWIKAILEGLKQELD